MRDYDHNCCVAFILICFIAHFALNVENNDSRIAYIPKKEFTRVIVDIMNGTTTSSNPELNNTGVAMDSTGKMSKMKHNNKSSNSGVFPGGIEDRRIVTPRSAAIQKAAEMEQRRSKKYFEKVKRDSFYHLQKGLMSRKAKLGNDEELSQLFEQENMSSTPRVDYYNNTPREQLSAKIF